MYKCNDKFRVQYKELIDGSNFGIMWNKRTLKKDGYQLNDIINKYINNYSERAILITYLYLPIFKGEDIFDF